MINVNSIDKKYNFEIIGPSYVGRPVSNTFMFVSKKIENQMINLKRINNCLIFVENGTNYDVNLKKYNCIIETDNPQLEYTKFAQLFDAEKNKINALRKYTSINGYFCGENVVIGENTIIEPGCLIDHDVKIGNNCRICSKTIIRNAIIGNNVLVNENALIGSNGFNMAEDENGNKIRIPTLGKVIISDNCEIGAFNNISCGSGGNTFLDEFVKLDALVHIGHDVQLSRNVEITAGSIIGGFVEISEGAYVGINSVLRNRINVGKKAFVGMGAVVTKSVEDGITVVGNPAKPFERK